jgi:hypothetical protein
MNTDGMPATRQDAINAGARHYFTGKPCLRGHLSPRYTESCNCLQCYVERIEAKRLRIRAIVGGAR